MNPPSSPQAVPPGTGTARAFFQADDYRSDQSLLLLLRRAQVALAQRVAERTELGGSTLPQWVPLYKVHGGHANTVAELARKCSIDAGAMTRLLDRLEAKGLCRRVRCDNDRRVVRIELTPEGVAAAEQVPRILSEVYNAALAGFSDAEWAQLQDLLGRLTDNAERLPGATESDS